MTQMTSRSSFARQWSSLITRIARASLRLSRRSSIVTKSLVRTSQGGSYRRHELGYNPRQGEAITVMRSVVGREYGYMIRVERLECLGHGHQARNFRVNAQDLPEGWNIEGLVGLSFLRQFNYEVRSV